VVRAFDATIPQVLVRSEKVPLKNKVLDVPRLLRATNVVELNGEVSSRLQHLPNGNYVYSIDTEKRLVLVPRALNHGSVNLDAPDATFVGSHEGIVKFLRSIYQTEPQFLPAGEITVRNGRVMMVSNGAGTYRGGSDHLAYAVGQLESHGLAIDARTERRDFSLKKYPDPHGLAPGQARAEIEATRDPGFASLQKTFRSVMKKIDEHFPGQFDFVVAAMAVKDRERQGRLLHAASLISSWQSPQEGEAFVIRSAVRALGQQSIGRASEAQLGQAGEAEVRALLKEVETFVDSRPAR
jgi:hypothetical protein